MDDTYLVTYLRKDEGDWVKRCLAYEVEAFNVEVELRRLGRKLLTVT